MTFDPPSDPYGDDKQCRICDCALEYDPWAKTWFCPNENCPYPPEEENETEEEEKETEPMNFKPLHVAYYCPTPSYREITEHIAIHFDDMTLVAVCGASEACEDAEIVEETRAYARLFAASPKMLEALKKILTAPNYMIGEIARSAIKEATGSLP